MTTSERASISTSLTDVTHVGIFTEIERHRRQRRRARQDMHFDRLTGLPNRARFSELLRERIAAVGEATVLIVNIDRFRAVNEQIGHEGGDRILSDLARRLRGRLRSDDVVARVSGDEFAILIPSRLEDWQSHAVAEMVRDLANACEGAQSLSAPLTVSIGICGHGEGAKDPDIEAETVFRNAIAAVDDARRTGPGGIATFTLDTAERHRQRYDLERALRQAVADGSFDLHFQPKIDMATGAMVGAEALIRWTNQLGETVSPALFIPLAEQTGLIHEIGAWTLKQVAAATIAWRDVGLPPLPIAVNLSALQLETRHALDQIEGLVASGDLDPHLLEVEVTETALANDLPYAVSMLDAVRAMGAHVALDDFGTGYSALTILQRLPVDLIKIDKCFVRQMLTDPSSEQIVRLIVSLAGTLGKSIVAEGVETQDEARFLVEVGCRIGQGWHYARAMPLADLMAFARRHGVGEMPTPRGKVAMVAPLHRVA